MPQRKSAAAESDNRAVCAARFSNFVVIAEAQMASDGNQRELFAALLLNQFATSLTYAELLLREWESCLSSTRADKG